MAILLPNANNTWPATPQNAGVVVTFVNHGTQLATDVTFTVTNNGRTDTIDARGKYKPGVKIQAQFPNFSGTDYWRDDPDECKLVHVTFADGSTWSDPELRQGTN